MTTRDVGGALVTAVVTTGILVAAFWAVGAAGIRQPRSNRALTMTPPMVNAAIDAELARRINGSRIRAMLGVSSPAPTPTGTAVVTRPGQAPVAAAVPADPAEYAAQAIESARAELSRALTRRMNIVALNESIAALQSDLSTSGVADDWIRQLEARVRASLTDDAIARETQDWTARVSADVVVQKAKGLPLADLLDVASLSSAIDCRVASVIAGDFVEPSTFAAVAADLTSRLTWAVTALLFVGLWLGTMAVVLRLVANAHGAAATIATALAAVVAGLCMYLASPNSTLIFGPMDRLRDSLATTAQVDLTSTVSSMNSMAVAAAVALLLFTGLTYLRTPQNPQELQDMVGALRTSFDIGAIFLTAGVLEIAVLYSWPATFASDSATADHIRSVARYVAAYAGVVFSLILALAYLPAPAIVAGHEAALGVAPEIRGTRGFGETAIQQLGRLLQVFLPLVIGLPFSLLLPG
jgi:hypothetical protein